MKFLSAVGRRTRDKLGTNISTVTEKNGKQRKRLARIGREKDTCGLCVNGV